MIRIIIYEELFLFGFLGTSFQDKLTKRINSPTWSLMFMKNIHKKVYINKVVMGEKSMNKLNEIMEKNTRG